MFSLVIPVFNEEGLIDELLSRCVSSLESFTDNYEIIIVDDGSTDSSLVLALAWRDRNPGIKVLALSKNFGHQAAFTAGLEHARGEIIGMMDGDLQDPPEILPEMYRKLTADGYDIVSGKKTGRRGSKSRNFSAWLFHLLFRHIGEIKDMENSGNYSVMNRKALEALLSMREKVRYLPGLRTYIGFRQGYVGFVRDDRFRGEPKMSIRKLTVLASDAIFSFSRFPIRFCLVL
ncbi:MAG: glycosyltransferase family 2 protein, partial [Bacteroidales bacterium]|nr:glycosyltransferase family 2 protein [Bacteroidales bacterium]